MLPNKLKIPFPFLGLPNLITLCNLLCGCFSIAASGESRFRTAIIWIAIGLFLDFTDGFLARYLKMESLLGEQLDSFSDLVSFGLAPSFLVYQIAQGQYSLMNGFIPFIPYFSWLIVVFTAFRLAKYNMGGEENLSGFYGLPSPANGLLLCSFPLAKLYNPLEFKALMDRPYAFLILILLSCFLLIVPIPLFNLKFKNLSWGENQIRFLFLILTSMVLGVFPFWGGLYLLIPIIVLLYFLFSLIQIFIKRP